VQQQQQQPSSAPPAHSPGQDQQGQSPARASRASLLEPLQARLDALLSDFQASSSSQRGRGGSSSTGGAWAAEDAAAEDGIHTVRVAYEGVGQGGGGGGGVFKNSLPPVQPDLQIEFV